MVCSLPQTLRGSSQSRNMISEIPHRSPIIERPLMGRWKQKVEAKGREGREDRTAQCPSPSVICPLVQTCRSASACSPDPYMPQAEWKADRGPSKGVTRERRSACHSPGKWRPSSDLLGMNGLFNTGMTFTWVVGTQLVGNKEVFISLLRKYIPAIPLADKCEKEKTEYSSRDLTEQGHIH